MTANRRLALLLPLALLLVSGCGGGGSSGSSGSEGGLDVDVLWEQPRAATLAADWSEARPQQQAGNGGFGPELPASVESVRFVIESAGGSRCCVSIDPRGVPVDPQTGQRSLLLKNLPPGSATLQVAGFPNAVAAAPEGEVATCATDPVETGTACAADVLQAPSFASQAQSVTIVQGARSDAGEILVFAVPFVIPGSSSPAPGETAENPIAVRFTVADAVTGIDRASIAVAVGGDGAAALALQACDDATSTPCSEGGRLDVRGFAVTRAAQALAPGPQRADIEARNLADPVRSLEFSYPFRASGVGPTRTAPAPSPTVTQAATRTATATSEPSTPTRQPRTPTGTPTVPTATARPSRTSTVTPTVEMSPSDTPTVTPTSRPTGSPIAFIPAEPIGVSAGVQFLAAARLDGDARTDLVVVSPESKEVNVLLGSNTSPSRFESGTVIRFGTRLNAPALGDVDGDGLIDVIVPDDAENGLWILIGDGNGGLSAPVLREVGQNPVAAAVIDLDREGNLDVAVLDRSENRLVLLTNDGGSPPVLARKLSIPVARAPEVLLTADFDQDEQTDLAVLSEGDDPLETLSVLLFNTVLGGTPVFDPASTVLVGERVVGLTIADVDHDLFPDILLLSRPMTTGNSNLVVVPMQHSGVPGAPIETTVVCPFGAGGSACPGSALAAGDFNLDAFTDVAAALDDPRLISNGDIASVLQGRGDLSFAPATSAEVPRSPRAAAVGDFNGDGLLDVAVGGRRDSVVQALVNVTNLGTGPPSP